MALPQTSILQLMAARHLFYLSKQNLQSAQPLRLFAGINLLHDAAEALLWAAVALKGTGGKGRADFMQLYTAVEDSIAPERLPFRPALEQLNRIRVDAKHYGIQPDSNEAKRILVRVTEFLQEATRLVFNVDFWTISLLDLLPDGEIKQILQNAQRCFQQTSYYDCLIECRKVIYLLFEQDYDISNFRDEKYAEGGILGGFSHAPYYVKNHKWIQENVRDPFGYIYLDHSRINQDLLIRGIETDSFWNIWRGTPSVFRYDKAAEWLVRTDLTKASGNLTEEHVAYILEQATDISLKVEDYIRRARTVPTELYYIRLKNDKVNVYKKADRNSAVTGVIEGLNEVMANSITMGLQGDGEYYEIMHISIDGSRRWYFGYVWNDDILSET